MGVIYKIENKINKKVYIGKTTRDIETRFYEHCRDSFNPAKNSKIHHAMKKYGVDNFYITELESCEEKLLNEREKYWVLYYDSFKSGYNNTTGGDGRSLSQEKINLIRKLWEDGLTIIEISEKMKLSHSTVYHRVSLYSDYDAKQNKLNAFKNISKKVCQYSLKKEYIQTFNSLNEAGRKLGVEKRATNIKYACDTGGTSFGYFWAYEGQPIKNKKDNKKSVSQYTLAGEYIQTFSGVRAAGKAMGIHYSGILKTCKGRQSTAAGYIWRYKEDE